MITKSSITSFLIQLKLTCGVIPENRNTSFWGNTRVTGGSISFLQTIGVTTGCIVLNTGGPAN